MSKAILSASIVSALLLATSAMATLPFSPEEREVSSIDIPVEEKNQTKRDHYIRIDKLLDGGIIKIKPGMTVLDIGTGIGTSAYAFAERLKGTGTVFATDILQDRIDFVKKEAEKRGFTNIVPVLVTLEGVDAFYGKHSYDLIYLSSAFHRLSERVAYFREMKRYLAKDGVLVVLMSKSAPLYHEDDVRDFRGLIEELSQKLPENEPFYKRLRSTTRELLNQQSDTEPDDKLKAALVEDFNGMLVEPKFYEDFQRTFLYKTVSFLPAERNFYNWLLMTLKEDGVYDENPRAGKEKVLDPKAMRAIIKLNKLLFSQRFRKYLEMNGAMAVGAVHSQTSRFLVERELKEAGYYLDHEYGLLPYSEILFFKANAGR